MIIDITNDSIAFWLNYYIYIRVFPLIILNQTILPIKKYLFKFQKILPLIKLEKKTFKKILIFF